MYIPKNKIITNLYTSGEEYQDASSLEYIGPYYKLYNGKIFSGKNPNDKPTFELFPFDPPITQSETPTTLRPGFTGDGPPYPSGFGEDQIKIEDNQVYIFLKEGKVTNKSFNLPYSFYPQPTEEDYNLGVFTRYFCVKINEDIYLEISKDTYDALTNQKGDWLWQLYTPFQLLWTISGEEKEIEKTNYNITLLQEKRLKRRGLQQFLRNNYLKFYPSPYNVSDVTSSITPTPTPVKENKPSIKDLFKITNPRPNLIISPEEIANARTATPLVTSSVGNPLTNIRVDTSFKDPKADQRRT